MNIYTKDIHIVQQHNTCASVPHDARISATNQNVTTAPFSSHLPFASPPCHTAETSSFCCRLGRGMGGLNAMRAALASFVVKARNAPNRQFANTTWCSGVEQSTTSSFLFAFLLVGFPVSGAFSPLLLRLSRSAVTFWSL